ncbi:MAG: type II and III secretion system protein family protein [Sphingomonas sp.]|uniref:type II and III secretion system protein family protein n=1 Tax=Sphingomonas sp. TaxID=28214 RepID=UPI0025FF587D|nr:type II and III secretion system protein family protein [Sphingomonas sp.]MBY0282887.1 type II and III secretion system protein family protein [Sphingomonas sp.]
MRPTILQRTLRTTVATALIISTPLSLWAQTVRPRPATPTRPHARPVQPRPMATHYSQLPAGVQRPTNEVKLSIGEGELITLPSAATDVWISNPTVADVYVRSARQLNLFGKDTGEATIFATAGDGQVVYAASVRVSQNLTSIDRMMKLAMPDADIRINTVGQIAVLTGTVRTPDDISEAQALAASLLNPGIDVSAPGVALKVVVINRLRTATPLQVQLHVKIAEVSRTFVKNISSNIATRDATGGFSFGVGSGRSPGAVTQSDLATYPTATIPTANGGTITGPYDPSTGQFINPRGSSISEIAKSATGFTTLGLAGKLFGLDILQAIDLGERNGQVSTLAEPNLTALSGETSSFLAGGEFPIPVSQGLGAVSIEYKQYGISLAYTPTVLSDGRISLRVRPEVSQLTSSGAVQINGTTIPALSTRRAETTVELGSGQSMMIAGLLQNDHNNSIEQTPGLGNIPVVGALFRSNGFQRNETELVIVITPYLVKPVNGNDIALPTDGYKAPTDLGRVFLGQLGGGTSGGERPKPSMAPPRTVVAPSLGVAAVPETAPAPQAPPATPARREEKAVLPEPRKSPSAAPGFNLQ